MARIFIALDLSKEGIDEIKRIQKILSKKNLFMGKLTEDYNLHLTLKFLGEISDEQVLEVKKRLSQIKFSELFAELGEIGVFNKDFIKIIWIKLNGKGIWDLQKQIDEKLLDLFVHEARFMSHITIARVKNVPNKAGFLEYMKSVKPKKIKFCVNEFVLKKSELFSQGPRYEDLEIYPLIKN
jgi:2'-5' RNA ligase